MSTEDSCIAIYVRRWNMNRVEGAVQCVILRVYVVVSIEWLLNSLEVGSSRVSGAAAAAPVVVSSFASSCYMLCFCRGRDFFWHVGVNICRNTMFFTLRQRAPASLAVLSRHHRRHWLLQWCKRPRTRCSYVKLAQQYGVRDIRVVRKTRLGQENPLF